MTNRSLTTVVHCLHRLIGLRGTGALSDAELIAQYAQDGDDVAFAELVRRHGRTVWNVCVRVLDSAHDAEDAFQATFLTLARKAGSVAEPALLGNWLYGVAYRISLKARHEAVRRRASERSVRDMFEPETTDEALLWRDLRPVLDEEVNRLPEKYRTPVVLCYFEGKAYEEAADLLGCPPGTVSGRLARAREMLRDRLTRRGVALSVFGLGSLLASNASAAMAPPMLVTNTIRVSLLYAAGGAAAVPMLSPHVIALAQGAVKSMMTSKMKLLLAAVLTLGLVGGGSLIVSEQAALLPQASAAPVPGEPASPPPAAKPATAAQREAWADLASGEDIKSAKALLFLGANPKETLAFLKENLPPVKADSKRVAQLIANLDSNEFATRQKAEEELEYLGKYAKEDLEKALKSPSSVDVKQRLQQLVDKLPKPMRDPKQAPNLNGANSVQVQNVNGQVRILVNGVPVDAAPQVAPGPRGPSSTWVRAVRAIAVLEHIGTPEAKQLLETISQGEADALPTEQAKAALERLGKK